jgi:hypothetical protein
MEEMNRNRKKQAQQYKRTVVTPVHRNRSRNKNKINLHL